MRKSKIQKHSSTSRCELAASVRKNVVEIYGHSLEDVCQRHRQAIKNTASYDLRAIEQGKFAMFMLSQIQNFAPQKRKDVCRHIVVLLETAIDTLSGLENRNKSKYHHIIHDFRQQLEVAASL